jgi:flagellar FliL protein
MAEDAKDGKDEDKAPPKKSKKKLIIIAGAVLIVILIAGGAFMFMGGGDDGGDSHSEAKDSGDSHGGEPELDSHGNPIPGTGGAAGAPQIMNFEPFIVNLTNTAGNRYLKVTINIEMDSGSMEEAKTRNAQIRDSIITLLSSKSYADVGSVSGKYQLRDEIAARMNLILEEGKVKSVYFTEFVIQ